MSGRTRLSSTKEHESTPGPGNYAQYSSIHHPLIFPRSGDANTYIIYENGRKFYYFAKF